LKPDKAEAVSTRSQEGVLRRLAGTTAGACDGPLVLDATRFALLGTPMPVSTYDHLLEYCMHRVRQPGCEAMEFTNTQVVTLRRHDPEFHELTRSYDYFIPDSTPVLWCMNWQGAGMKERVYGPVFMRHCLSRTPRGFTHYFLGGSEECGVRLREVFRALNAAVTVVGSCHGRCTIDGVFESPSDEEVVAEINTLSPDFVWVGLGTPRQQGWISRHKHLIKRGVLLGVGFAFDTNAGIKLDAPLWMQRSGFGWLFRLMSEPQRLLGRYLKYNSLFLWYLAWDGLRGRAFAQPRSQSALSAHK
jgi:N-acetylglucosaminyldiphosphoundecaprenol N-acetyl-beta-D-mannosaminyltransferase